MDSLPEPDLFSAEADAFYDRVRGYVVIFLFLSTTSWLAHAIIQYFKDDQISLIRPSRSDRAASQLITFICTFALMIALTGFSLLPFSIIANEILLAFPKSYYIQWLDDDVFKGISLAVNFGSKVSFIMLPFAYLLLISPGYQTKYAPFRSRLSEAINMLLFLLISLFGAIWACSSTLLLLYAQLTGQSSSLFHLSSSSSRSLIQSPLISYLFPHLTLRAVPSAFIQSIETIQLVFSLLGLLILSTCTPLGLLKLGFKLWSLTSHSLPDLTASEIITTRIENLHFTWLSWTNNLEPLKSKQGQFALEAVDSLRKPPRVKFIRDQLERLQCQINRSSRQLAREFLRPITSLAALLVTLGLLRLIETYVCINIAALLLDLVRATSLFSYFFPSYYLGSSTSGGKAGYTVDASFSLGNRPVSALGPIGAVFQIGVVHLLLLVSLWGFYCIPYTRLIRPRLHGTNLEALIVNILLLLLFSSALPIHTNLLGLTTLRLPDVLKVSRHPPRSMYPNAADSAFAYTSSLHSSHLLNDHNNYCSSSSSSKSLSTWPRLFVFRLVSSFDFTSSAARECSLNDHDKRTQLTTTTTIPYHDTVGVEGEESLFSQFVSLAFGTATDRSSFNLVLLLLFYNLCFLATSVWITWQRLCDKTLALSLYTFRLVRYLHLSAAAPTAAAAAVSANDLLLTPFLVTPSQTSSSSFIVMDDQSFGGSSSSAAAAAVGYHVPSYHLDLVAMSPSIVATNTFTTPFRHI